MQNHGTIVYPNGKFGVNIFEIGDFEIGRHMFQNYDSFTEKVYMHFVDTKVS